MGLYDRYSEVVQGHYKIVQRAERNRQERILRLLQPHLPSGDRTRVLEVGVGTGLYAYACRARHWDYTGIDRNRKMVDQLRGEFHIVCAEVPPLPAELDGMSFDLTYSAYVLEHLADGLAALEFTETMKSATKPGGIVALVVPDALSLGMEFWNLDYTHRYPTAERNVTQILLESGLEVERVIRYRGPGWTGLGYWILRAMGAMYSYRFWAVLIRRRDLCYSVYQYIKQDMLIFIARKPE